MVMLSAVEPETVTWLWPQRIALGKLTLITGDPGLGKSLMTADFAARVTTGTAWPDGAEACERGSVIFLTAEDGLADTLAPRLDAAHADRSKIAAINGIDWFDDENKKTCDTAFSLERDLTSLEDAVRTLGDCRLIIIDPLSAYLGRVDSHRNTEVRSVLAPLAELAERHQVAVVCIDHLNKGQGPAIYRNSGSTAFVAAARAVFGVAKDKADPDVRLFFPIKANLAKDRTGLSYRITEDRNAPVLNWSPEPKDIDADEAVSHERDENTFHKQSQATQWLRATLADGALLQEDVLARGANAGFSEATLKRAKRPAEVNSFKPGGRGTKWYWGCKAKGDQRSPEQLS
jgi:putative DNA primase/helicase